MGFRRNVDESVERYDRAYLDYAATAPFDGRLMSEVMNTSWANASSLYYEGRRAFGQLEDARKRVAAALGAHAPSEIVFTSGGTESDNTALFGLAGKAATDGSTHVVVSAIEHHAVLHAADALKARGFKVERLAPGPDGVVGASALAALLEKVKAGGGTCPLVSIHAVNNELGTIQPIRELAEVAHSYGARFACDAVQALGKLDIDLEASGVDAAAFSGHKIGTFKGCGVLYIRRGVRCAPLLRGGGQEAGMRSGTSNVLGACMLAKAVEFAVAEREVLWERAAGFKVQLLHGLEELDAPHGIRPTLPQGAACVPHIVHLLCDGLEGETVVLRLDNAGVSVSAGSACSSGSLDPSHVLTAIGLKRDEAYGSLRVSFGPNTANADVAKLLEELPGALR